ncbi:MAG TPA: 4-(cytidine 5'-diphospho)-2-C-methyl-D-erythritol kinase, partial [Candidatus Galloscillospira excrementavium]|nr:4-(cytidine 5'-diphospho)-2-C-methyl-D-erythritol kinase [Candidatus Galloscillospira excrementavium]
MPQTAEVKAYAKLNLSLDVLGTRADGYHDLRMVMQSVALADTLRLEIGTGEGLKVTTSLRFLPNNEKNLAAAAALAFQEDAGVDLGGVSIDIRKAIPVCAGMAGGSSDAAAALRALNDLTGAGWSREELARLGERVGSDVPYCVLGGTALAEGRGEKLTP